MLASALLHHVSLELEPADAARFGELLGLIGFDPIQAPATMGDDVRWFASAAGDTQVHLILIEDAVVPNLAHPAFVAAPFGDVLERLTGAGFAPEERRPHWGERRAFLRAPGGHRIELMAAPPG